MLDCHFVDTVEQVARNFGHRMKSRREMMGMSRHALSMKTRIEVDTIDALEQGECEADAAHVFHLASALNVSPNFFFHGLPAAD